MLVAGTKTRITDLNRVRFEENSARGLCERGSTAIMSLKQMIDTKRTEGSSIADKRYITSFLELQTPDEIQLPWSTRFGSKVQKRPVDATDENGIVKIKGNAIM